MKGRKRLILILNILAVIAMLVHVTAAYLIHRGHPEWSAPAYMELINTVFYLIPLLLFDLLCLLIGRLHARKQRISGTRIAQNEA